MKLLKGSIFSSNIFLFRAVGKIFSQFIFLFQRSFLDGVFKRFSKSKNFNV